MMWCFACIFGKKVVILRSFDKPIVPTIPADTIMIEEIKFENVLSFRDETVFSFEATEDTTFDAAHVVVMPDGRRLLRLGIVYGANASGKSNLLEAINSLFRFLKTDPKSIDRPLAITPFLLDRQTPGNVSKYTVTFWVEGHRYLYYLEANRQHVVLEQLSMYEEGERLEMLFERRLEDGSSVLQFNPALQLGAEEVKALTLYCLPNKSFFAARGNVNLRIAHVDAVRQWMYEHAMPLVRPQTSMTSYLQAKIGKNTDFRTYLTSFLQAADFNITGIMQHEEDAPVPEPLKQLLLEAEDLSEEERQQILSKGTIPQPVLEFEHTVRNARGTETYRLDMSQQSEGTTRLIGIEAALYDALSEKSFLMIDEIETSIHPALLTYLLQHYLQRETQSQLLITTHNQGLLQEIDQLLRRDNIWFVEKTEAGSSSLYSLVEFEHADALEHIDRAYRNGRFGALPNIKD